MFGFAVLPMPPWTVCNLMESGAGSEDAVVDDFVNALLLQIFHGTLKHFLSQT